MLIHSVKANWFSQEQVASVMFCDQESEEKWYLRQHEGGLSLLILSSEKIEIRRNVLNLENEFHANATFFFA